jgi:hypothetical protein
MKMIQIGLWVVCAMSAVSAMGAFAAEADDTAQLGNTMKDMAATLATITSQVSNSADNTSSETLCDRLTADIDTAKTLTPPKIAVLPADQQATQEQAYDQLLDQLAAQVANLKSDLVSGNNAAAAQDITAIQATENSGHSQFAH